MTMTKSETIKIQIGNEVIELSGADKEAFLDQRAKDQAESAILEAKESERKQLRIDAITKLGAASGLTEEEINSILNI